MENSKFKTEYKLKQHTVLLHFQAKPSSGENVCLRASEVKPKLDRFILKKLGEIKTVKEKYSSWIQAEHLNGNDVAFKYRMTIVRCSERMNIYETDHRNNGVPGPNFVLPDIYYGNMGDGPQKYGVFFIDGLKIKITCFIPDLKKFIEENIAEFFAVTNFGTMQNKGFGSFTIEGIDEETVIIDEETVIEALKNNYDSKKCFKVAVNQSVLDNDVQKELFDTVKQVYSVMKSGSRVPFKHSYIYEYMHNEYKVNGERVNIGNEKAAMKIEKVSPALGRQGMGGFSKTFKYVRAVLGIGSSISYITDNPWWYELDNNGKIKFDSRHIPIVREDRNTGGKVTKKLKENIEIYHVKNDKGTPYPPDSKVKIERISSPIFFKIIDNNIYIVARRIDENIYNKFFAFENDCKNKTSKEGLKYRRNQTKGTVVLQVPNEFDIDDFMEKFVEFYNTDYLNCDHRGNQNFKNYHIEEV